MWLYDAYETAVSWKEGQQYFQSEVRKRGCKALQKSCLRVGPGTAAIDEQGERGLGWDGGMGGGAQKGQGRGHNGELTHKLAVGAVLWEGAGHEVQQAAITPRAT